MRIRRLVALALLIGCGGTPDTPSPERLPDDQNAATGDEAPAEDPYLWLEEVDSERSLAWVRERNAESQSELEADPRFGPLRDRLLSILDSDDRIPTLSRRGDTYTNFWRDAAHPRGLWRRTSLRQYRRDEPRWETILDLDALAEAEDENWVWKYAVCEHPTARRCLLMLSRGGADATVVREFDTVDRAFVDGGFTLPEAKTRVSWIDRDHLFVATDFGEGTMTESGYPRQVRIWERGTPLSDATLVREGRVEDMLVMGARIHTAGHAHDSVWVRTSFFASDEFLRRGDEYVQIDKPSDADLTYWGDRLLLRLRTDWTVGERTYAAGSLLMADIDAFLAGEREMVELFTPTETTALEGYTSTRSRLLINVLEDVQTRLYAWSQRRGEWTRTRIHEDIQGTQRIYAVDDDDSDEYWHFASSFIAPTQYSIGDARDRLTPLKTEPTFFDASGLTVSQHFVESRDGTRVPYFLIGPEDAAPDAPTLLYGYGGFEIAITPSYRSLVGAGWLEQGGIYAIANIRGGGEYGARWHTAALRHNRQRAYDDFIAVAEDLIERGVTETSRLGIEGRSNGGLLMGVMLTQRPDLFGAVVCGVPLLDMRRFHRLLAGASWVEEYGDPDDPADWAALSRFSPYQNVSPDTRYPPTLFYSSTRDDRVHPAHARKMVARMRESSQPVLYYENLEGGHRGAANNAQRAYTQALTFTFLRARLGESAAAP